jgi:hypothetical protein
MKSFLTGLAGASTLAFALFILPNLVSGTPSAPAPAPTGTTQQH